MHRGLPITHLQSSAQALQPPPPHLNPDSPPCSVPSRRRLKLLRAQGKVQQHAPVALADLPLDRSLVTMAGGRSSSDLASPQAAHEEQGRAEGGLEWVDVTLKHKYAGTMLCKMAICNAGGGLMSRYKS